MPYTIVFDTNYLRSFGDSDYLAGRVPQKLHSQIELAISGGDLVVLPNTVRLETNAWLATQSQNNLKSLDKAHQLLKQAGYKISPETVEKVADVDIALVLRKLFSAVYLLEPSIEDYKEAERRTSYRLPPLPKNRPDGEEFRDRLIWCQLISLAHTGNTPILIVSADGFFKNGAASPEGRKARIEVVEGEADLDQRLNQRPHHIQIIVDQLLMFAARLQTRGVELKTESIAGIEDLRKINDANGSLVQKFTLRTTAVASFPSSVTATIISLGETPISLNLTWNGQAIEVVREVTAQEAEQLTLSRFRNIRDVELAENELKALTRG